MIFIGSFFTSNSISNEKISLFLANELAPISNHTYKEILESEIETDFYHKEEIKKILSQSLISDAITMIAIQYYLLNL